MFVGGGSKIRVYDWFSESMTIGKINITKGFVLHEKHIGVAANTDLALAIENLSKNLSKKI